MTTHNDSWEERFEEKFCTVDGERYANIVNGDWPVKKELIKLFISTEIAAAEKRKVAEIREKVEEMIDKEKDDLKYSMGIEQEYIAHKIRGLSSALSLLRADNETGV